MSMLTTAHTETNVTLQDTVTATFILLYICRWLYMPEVSVYSRTAVTCLDANMLDANNDSRTLAETE